MYCSMNNDLNSALALFRSLFKTQKGDIYTIIERFILVGVRSKGLISFTQEDLSELLKDSFHVVIPFSVIRKCLNTHQDVFKYSRGKYIVINPMNEEIDRIIEEMKERESYREKICSELFNYIEKKKDCSLSGEDKDELLKLFYDFVIDKDRVVDNDHRLFITQFIIEKEKDEQFQSFLNSLREGMIIYTGIRYSDSPNDISWEYNTDFFLDEEYLFSAYGMNGQFYEKCFFEFYDLVKEINKASMMKEGRERIRLYYFSETKKDIESYFAQAIRIRRMQERYNYPQTAMDSILNACKEDVDIEIYKTNFYGKLKGLHILEFPEEIDLRHNQDYLFENEDFEAKKDQHFEPDDYPEVNDYVKIADYINILRQGKSGYPLERCRCMFLSDGNLSNELSRFIRDYYAEKKPFVITRMGVFTELMWFKLRKGVVDTSSNATISVVNKAKTVVSGLLYDNLKKQYDAVLEMDADENAKRAIYADLRTKRYAPDDITSDTIAEDIAFIGNDDFLKEYEESQKQLKRKAEKADILETELGQEREEKKQALLKLEKLEQYVENENKRKKKEAIVKARRRISFRRFFFKYYVWIVNVLIVLAFVLPSLFCMDLKWVNIATVGGFLLAVELAINPFFCKNRNKVRRLFLKKYKAVLAQEMEKLGIFNSLMV